MDRARERHRFGNPEPWRIQGAGKLNRRGLAALRILWHWRNNEAKIWDKPSFMVCSNSELLEWSFALMEQKNLVASPRFHPHRKERFFAAVRSFYLLDEEEYPERPRCTRRQYTDQFYSRMDELTKLRDQKSAELNIEGSFLITRASMEAISEDEEAGRASLLDWQREALGL
jgi:ribonuclease D